MRPTEAPEASTQKDMIIVSDYELIQNPAQSVLLLISDNVMV
jgi:hypothetical protein